MAKAKGPNIANATIAVTPTFPGLGKAVKSAFDTYGVTAAKSGGAKAGGAFGDSFGKGIVKSGAVAGAASAVAQKAISAVSSSMDAAIARFDTLNNYPKTMEALGYAAGEVNSSLSTMDEHLQGLPTSLDSMVSLVQGLTVTTNDLTLATDAGLALNDMLVASGSSQQLASAAMEQFRQILSKGKPEMQDWRSLTSAMPGQMDQLAKSMLGASASADDLYKALGGGGEDPTVTMDELLAAMVRLDKEGGEGIASFEQQARTASGGISTSMSNLQTAVTRGLANTMEAIGKENIAQGFTDMKDAVNAAFAAVNAGVSAVMPAVSSAASGLREIAPQAASAVAGFAAVKVAGGGMASLVGAAIPKVKGLREAFQLAAGGAGTLRESLALVGVKLNPVAMAITGAAAIAGLAAGAFMDWKTKTDNARKATEGLADAVADTAALKDYAGKVAGIGEKSKEAGKSLDELNKAMAGHVDKMSSTASAAATQVAQLSTAQSVINEYAGETDLSSEAQGRLEWALKLVNDQFGLSVTAADVMAGAYRDANGDVVNLKDSINELIKAKKNEIEMEAMTQNLSEAYSARTEAADAYAAARDDREGLALKYQREYAALYTSPDGSYDYQAAQDYGYQKADEEIAAFKGKVDDANAAVSDLEAAIGDSAKAASGAADGYDEFGDRVKANFASVDAILRRNVGASGLSQLKDDLRTLGADTGDLCKLSEDQLTGLADAYDGTAASIVGKLKEMGVGMDEAAAAQAQAASDLMGALSDMGASLDGVDTSLFCQKLAEAGVSTDKLNKIGSDNLAELAKNCDGDVGRMVWLINNYNDTPILDKDGHVQVDSASLMDAQGNLYTWNGTDLLDKDGEAVVDAVSLTDAQGNLWTWNGSALQSKDGSATVEHGSLVDANGHVRNWLNTKDDLGTKTGTVNIFENIFKNVSDFFSGNAAGGIRLNAAGGVRFHAGGAIATRAVPLDVVGEAGAEAIVPLTNRRYSQPFADLIADQVNEGRGGEGASEVIAWLSANLPAIIERYTPTVGERDFARMARKAVSYA